MMVTDISVLSSDGYEKSSHACIFFVYIILALFPWSVPLVISFLASLKNYRQIKNRFIELKLLQRFGIVIFVFSIPSFWFYSQFSFVLLLASIFFNAPLVGKVLIMQFNHNPNVWKFVGISVASIIGIGTLAYLLMNLGVSFSWIGIKQVSHHWCFWNIILMVVICISIYTLSRNRRDVLKNHRYFYNIIILYLLAQNLFIGYILPSIQFV